MAGRPAGPAVTPAQAAPVSRVQQSLDRPAGAPAVLAELLSGRFQSVACRALPACAPGAGHGQMPVRAAQQPPERALAICLRGGGEPAVGPIAQIVEAGDRAWFHVLRAPN